MKIRIFFYFLSILFGLSASTILQGGQNKILPPPEQVSKHVYAWIGPHGGPSQKNNGYRMNLAFVVGNNAVAVLETGYTETMAKEILKHIAAITNVPVKYAINSNSQPDRYLGNAVFLKHGITIIAHKKEVARMNSDGSRFTTGVERALGLPKNSVALPPEPNQIITKPVVIDLGGHSIKIQNLGLAAHTPAPLIVHIPEDNVLYAGDIIYGGRLPAILNVSHVGQWLKSFEKLKGFGNITIIPGHGEPGLLSTFNHSTRDYLTLLDTHMAKMVDQGIDLQDAIQRLDQSAYSDLENYKELAGRNASWAYLEKEADSFN